jgi:hypothetical protein
VVIFPQCDGETMNVFFTTDLALTSELLLEAYGGRFKIKGCFDERKTVGAWAITASAGHGNQVPRHAESAGLQFVAPGLAAAAAGGCAARSRAVVAPPA